MHYKIGDFTIALKQPLMPLVQDEMMERFACSSTDAPDFTFYGVPLEPKMLEGSKVLQHTGGYELRQTDKGMFLLNHWASCRMAYGIWPHKLDGDVKIYCNPELQTQIPMTVNYLLSTTGLHHKLLQRQAVILHASYIEYQGQAIIFLGPSGMGKSTQAELWRHHANASIINGDRVLLRQKDGQWYVYGYPCCGSSLICVNRTLKLGAIVVLQKALENRIETLSAAKRICALTTASELYPWASWEMEAVLSIAESLAEQTVLQLSCRAEKEAVFLLRDYLEARL